MGEEMFTMKSEVVCQPPAMSDDLVQSVGQKICERQRFIISEVSCEFPKIAHTVLYKIITIRLSYHKFCTKWVPKMLTGVHNMQRMASALTFYCDTTKMAMNFSVTSYE
jgi:hypothetical protein